MSDSTERIEHVIRVGLGPVLTAAGFTRDGLRFHRRGAHANHVTEVERRKIHGLEDFTLRLAVYFPMVRRPHPSCQEMIGRLMGGEDNHRWRLAGADLDALAAEVGRAWTDLAPAWFAARQDMQATAATCLAAGNYYHGAAYYVALEDRATAQAALTAGLEAYSARGEEGWLDSLRRLAWEHGLDLGAHDSPDRWGTHGPHWWGEEGWHVSANPHHLLALLERNGFRDNRKFRLGAAGMCRQVWGRLPPVARAVVEVAEAYADGRVTFRDLRTAEEARRESPEDGARLAASVAHREARLAIVEAPSYLLGVGWGGPLIERVLGQDTARADLCRRLAAVVRDLFGNPFRPAAVAPAWRTAEVRDLARGIYEERAFDRLPILADALEEAGCDPPDLLGHCRGAGLHVRGCWVIDAVLASPRARKV